MMVELVLTVAFHLITRPSSKNSRSKGYIRWYLLWYRHNKI